MIIAIDGPAASGKGTLAIKIAQHYQFAHLDTGLLYRAVAFLLSQKGLDLQDEPQAIAMTHEITEAVLADPHLRGREMGEGASVVAALPGLRAALVDYQRKFATSFPGAVLDGRDIGTVICPDADVKLFVTASLEERSQRRFKELSAKGQSYTYEDILADLKKRDERDSGRSSAPLKAADDAFLIDTTNMTPAEALKMAIRIINSKRTKPSE
ncbi:(d)CMP kinase [Microvirga sp. W0021]|uniref:Cytidylate kinase n=1 Tax=Hohaiivirga grylli TaxID=3133970 RepID=A0ABV0BGX4_9HYPH